MALVECSNCGRGLLTEADTIIYQNRPQGEYHSCGCVERQQVAKRCAEIANMHAPSLNIVEHEGLTFAHNKAKEIAAYIKAEFSL